MNNINKVKLIALTLSIFSSVAVNAVEIESNGYTFGFNGYINTHLVYVSCDDNPDNVAGNALLCTGDDATSVSNGYSPASFQFSAATQKNGVDIKAVFAYEPGSTDNSAFNGGGDNKAYRAFFTVGNEQIGTFKAGRDYGVFGIDIVLQDISLSGVGAPALVTTPLNTSLGGAGYGYIFTDRLSQLTYSYTKNGLSGAIGVFQPLDPVSFGGNGFVGDSGSKTPGIHGKLRYDFDRGFVSTTFLTQSVDTALNDYNATGIDLTLVYNIGDTSLLASGFSADGLGYYGLLIDGSDSAANPRDSDGYFIQATYRFDNTKVGVNYGVSNIDLAPQDTAIQVKRQSKFTLGIYHTLWSMVTISAEYSDINAENHQGGEIKNQAISVGAALSF
ncbi:porin [Aliiglaciecola sp. 3_MG-2023]|uniref:porin n=1 Tax=Aliiglaciecola sp. 3_MG-2023 TaxID=3062644 RepID=UPI0026E1A722|nr:porin [Aliiglaciecola sp. 3_MG-2023]MDO6694809.1 porin [Aliiglaciecola sp. 3_MG-2023]